MVTMAILHMARRGSIPLSLKFTYFILWFILRLFKKLDIIILN